jgi:SIR2-like domain
MHAAQAPRQGSLGLVDTCARDRVPLPTLRFAAARPAPPRRSLDVALMSKPRWIDAGVFQSLRAATRNRKLTVIAGPRHGSAEISSRAQLKVALADGDRSAAAADARLKSKPDEGLMAVYGLKLAGLVTTAVSDAALASAAAAAANGNPPRVFGPDTKGLNSAWDRKDPFVVQLCGSPSEPSTLVLTNKDRKPLLLPDSRYQNFLRATFARTVLFSGFDLSDPDLIELLEDVSRGFNGHVPPNLALVPAGATEPSTALRASMHYGTQLVEYPPDRSPADVLHELVTLLEELEIPKPATGDPPRGFTELTPAVRKAVPVAEPLTLELFDRGDSSSWQSVAAGADAPRTVAAQIQEFLLGPVEPGQLKIALVRARQGEGKTTLLRRISWDLANAGRRVFWREFGAGVPDRYVAEEAEGAIAIFVGDDAHELDNLPSLVNYLAAHGAGKARFLLAAEGEEWDRSGLDHRIRRTTTILDVALGAPDEAESRALAEGLQTRGRLGAGKTVDTAAEEIRAGDRCLMDRIAGARGVGSVEQAVASRISGLDEKVDRELLRRAYLATALVHRYGMSLGRAHLAAVVGVPEDQLEARVLKPLDMSLVPAGAASVRTRHPVVAAAACRILAGDPAVRDSMAADLLRTLPGGSVSDQTVFHRPSELIRALRHGQVAPLTVDHLFVAGENAAANDVHFWYDRGRFDETLNRWEPALAHLDRALWRQPGAASDREHNAAVQGHRARCLQQLGRKAEALAAVEDGLRLAPRDGVLERLYEKLGGRRHEERRGGPPGRGGAGRGGPGGERRGPPGAGGPREGGGRGFGGGGRGGPGGPGGPGGQRRNDRDRERPARRGPPPAARPAS